MTSAPGRRRLVATALLAVVVLAAAAACGGAGTTAGPIAGTGATRAATAPEAAVVAPATTPGTAPGTAVPGTTPGTAPPSPPRAAATTSPSTTTTVPAAPAQVTTVTLPLVDTSRPTVSRGRTVRATRPLTTTVYLPPGTGPHPLVVFGHGYRLGPPSYARICRALAEAGYVVAAPSFPLADEAVAGADLDRGDLPNQAGDVAFVISQLLGPAGGGALAGRVDGGHIGVVGHSDGADTALDVGYVAGRNDPRVRAVVALSPDPIPAPGASVGQGVPLLVVHGDRDSIAPYSGGRTVFGQVGSHRLFVRLLGADHLPPVQGAAPWTPVLDATVVAFLDRYVAGRGADDAAVRAAADRPGIATVEVAG